MLSCKVVEVIEKHLMDENAQGIFKLLSLRKGLTRWDKKHKRRFSLAADQSTSDWAEESRMKIRDQLRTTYTGKKSDEWRKKNKNGDAPDAVPHASSAGGAKKKKKD